MESLLEITAHPKTAGKNVVNGVYETRKVLLKIGAQRVT